jgi:lactoylglutathione lyase
MHIYTACTVLREAGHTINRPPRDGFKAYVETVDGLTVELIQRRPAKEPAEPWLSMPDNGHWNG